MKSAGSMSLLVLSVFSSITLIILGCWQMLVARQQLIQRSIIAEQEEQLCAAMAEIGIILARQHYHLSDEREQVVEYRIPGPSWYSTYFGVVSCTIGKPMIPLQVNLFREKKICRALRLVLTFNRERNFMQVLEWVPV